MQKIQLKEEAKSLLLKGCYKMASIKYQRLIQLGGDGFSQRQWAVIHLNKAICHQFLQQYEEAQQLANRSIQIDPTYEKAYYRRIQILRQLRRFEQAISAVPNWLKNKEIEQLQKQIRQEYLNSLGIDQIIEDLMEEKKQKIVNVRESHLKFCQRLIQQLQNNNSEENLRSIGLKIAKYYVLLKNLKETDRTQSFLAILHILLVKSKQNKQKQNALKIILQQFWAEYENFADCFKGSQITKQNLKNKQQYKILKYAPINIQTLRFLQNLIIGPLIRDEQVFEYTVQLSHQLTCMNISNDIRKNSIIVVQTLSKLITNLTQNMNHSLLGWLKRSFLLTDSLIKLHLHLDPYFKLNQQINQLTLFYMRYFYINTPTQQIKLEIPIIQKISLQKIVSFLQSNIQDFIIVYVLEQFAHRLDKTIMKTLIPDIQEQLDLLKDLKMIQKNKFTSKMLQMSKQYQLIYTSLMLKIDLKHATNRINIPALLSYKHNRQNIYDQSLSDLSINTLLLLALSSNNNLTQILSHPHTITTIVKQYSKNSFTQQLQSLGIVISLAYITVIDLELIQVQSYAKKMGVNRQQIQKARQIQGQSEKPKLKEELTLKRKHFKQYIVKHWSQIMVEISILLLKIKEQSSLIKWSRFLTQIAQIDASRFHHPKIIEVMNQSFKYDRKNVGKFFSLLCKKINAQLLKYQQIQTICDILVYNIENAEHQLIIFQSLLGLINLTSNSNNKVKVQIKPLQNCLLQQNRYIVHGALELLNNVLVYCDKQQIDKQTKIKEIVQKYINFYRDQVVNYEQVMPITDYSHPSKIYCTLLSLAIVMDLEHIEQFISWTNSQQAILKIQTPRSITLFKMALYMHMKQKLKGRWWDKFQKQIKQLQISDRGRWLKLKQYMK